MMLQVLCVSSLLLLVRADTSVHILSTKYGHGQLVTSSILNWIPESHYSASKDFVIGGFEIVESPSGETTQRPIFVCRAQHNGIWVAGGQKEGTKSCTVTLTGSVGSYERYQLLENVDSAARLNWYDWSKYYQPPVGSVATDKLYVARHIADQSADYKPTQTHYVGTLSAQDTLGTITYVKENGEEGSADEGQLLVETEPIRYELNEVKLNQAKERVIKRKPLVLTEATIGNTGDSPAKLAEGLAYSYQYTLYWGQGHAMLKGLNTTVTLHNETKLPDMNWGLEIRENRTSIYTVEVYLEPGTAVKVTLRGDYTDVEVPYSGKLSSHYEDKVSSSQPRFVTGTRREETLTNIVPELGPVYFLGNLSLAPTTLPPPTTQPPTTTAPTTVRQVTTFTPTTYQQQTVEEEVKEQQREESNESRRPSASLDENAILPSEHRPEGMQGDDGGPVSLTNKAEGAGNGAVAISVPRVIEVAGFVAVAVATSFALLVTDRVT